MNIASKPIKIGALSMFGLILSVIISCSAKHSAMVKPEAMVLAPYPTVTISHHISVKKDTIRIKMPINKAELDRYIKEAYKFNNEQFFAPQLNKMTLVISKQADAINGFQDIITSMRLRAIRHNDSLTSQSQYYIKQALKAQNDAITYQKLYIEKTKKQTESNNILSACFIVGFILLAGLLAGLWFRVNALSKKADKILQYA